MNRNWKEYGRSIKIKKSEIMFIPPEPMRSILESLRMQACSDHQRDYKLFSNPYRFYRRGKIDVFVVE